MWQILLCSAVAAGCVYFATTRLSPKNNDEPSSSEEDLRPNQDGTAAAEELDHEMSAPELMTELDDYKSQVLQLNEELAHSYRVEFETKYELQEWKSYAENLKAQLEANQRMTRLTGDIIFDQGEVDNRLRKQLLILEKRLKMKRMAMILKRRLKSKI